MGSPVHDTGCMCAKVMTICSKPPARVKQVDGGSEVPIPGVSSHDPKLIPEDVCNGHIYKAAVDRTLSENDLLWPCLLCMNAV